MVKLGNQPGIKKMVANHVGLPGALVAYTSSGSDRSFGSKSLVAVRFTGEVAGMAVTKH